MNKRNAARMARYNAQKQAEHLIEMKEKIHKDGRGIIEYKVDKAMKSTAPRDDLIPPAEPKDDAAFRVVNHAHQRDPKKKWS